MAHIEASFILSAAKASQFVKNEEGLIEICFAGRSNVGKSSMMNKLLNRKSLVKVGNTPGKTRLVNFFNVERDRQKYLWVDLPGYGYAKVSKKERDDWKKLIESYFLKRANLSLCIMLIDIRHNLQESDREMLEFLYANRTPYKIVLTKADKLSRNEQAKQVALLKKEIASCNLPHEELITFSSLKGIGIDEVWNAILSTDSNSLS